MIPLGLTSFTASPKRTDTKKVTNPIKNQRSLPTDFLSLSSQGETLQRCRHIKQLLQKQDYAVNDPRYTYTLPPIETRIPMVL